MRILYAAPMYAPVLGGGELLLQETSERLVARGHAVTVFAANVADGLSAWMSRDAGFPASEFINGVKVVRFSPRQALLDRGLDLWLKLPGGRRAVSTVLTPGGLEFLLYGPRALPMIGAILGERPDVVASMNWHWAASFYAYLARRIARFRLVGIPLFHTTQPWSRRPIYDRMLAACDAVAAMTGHEKSYAERRGAPAADVVGAGVSPREFERRDGADIRARYGLGDHPVVGYVGRQQTTKGVAKLIAAMPSVWRWNPDVRLVLAGHGTPEPEVEAELRSLAPEDRARVVQIGRFGKDEKASIFDAFDVFAMPSKDESFGIGYLEAWLCRKPVIGARIGSTQCVIDEGRDGLLVDPDSAEEIAGAIVSLLADRQLRTTMADAGYAKTIARHTWDKVTDRMESLYRRVVGAPRE